MPTFPRVASALVMAACAPCVAQPALPKPYETPSVTKHPKEVGWAKGAMPVAPAGFKVAPFATDLSSPRWLCILPNGDVLISQSKTVSEKSTTKAVSPNLITLLRDADHDGKAEVRETFAAGLVQPFGMALVGETLFVGTTESVVAFAYKPGQTHAEGKPRHVLSLPAGGYNHHWTRNLIANGDGSKLYITVGSASNVAEYGINEEILRANVLECNPDGTGLRVFASGLRNPVGLAWEPVTHRLWTAVNERDELGDDLVPDYMTSVQENGFYGWPYSYFGRHEDPRRAGERPDLVAKSIVPDVDLGAHTASLGLVFNAGDAFPAKFRAGAFIGQHGSWNRSKFTGYAVVFVPFSSGVPSGPPEPFLTGFIASESEVHGRPVGVAVTADGSLLDADDSGNAVWCVRADNTKSASGADK